MNERIRELADEAVTRVALRCEGSMESDKHGEWIRYNDLGKFAELIVRECVSVINAEAAEHEDDDEIERAWKMGTEFAVYQIKLHFGVEE